MPDNDVDGNGDDGDRVKLGRKDFQSDQEVRWCPGCGDYSILAAMQLLLPDLGVKPENLVFVSGIGCAARFPYYMNIYGLHCIHGRAPAVATGVALARPDLDVWVIGGDGDMLSIGGNHLIHALRRNVNLTIIMFNNQIYGLTKGQYSPTSEVGKITKSSPFGSLDTPFNPMSVALGAEATFVARTHDMDRKHMMEVFQRAHEHQGSAFVEIYQNCNVFNDGAFEAITGEGSARRHAHRAAARRADPLRRRQRARRRAQRVRRVRDRRGRRRRRGRAARARRDTATTRRSRSRSSRLAVVARRCRRPIGVFRDDRAADLRGRGAAPARRRGRSVRAPATSRALSAPAPPGTSTSTSERRRASVSRLRNTMPGARLRREERRLLRHAQAGGGRGRGSVSTVDRAQQHRGVGVALLDLRRPPSTASLR